MANPHGLRRSPGIYNLRSAFESGLSVSDLENYRDGNDGADTDDTNVHTVPMSPTTSLANRLHWAREYGAMMERRSSVPDPHCPPLRSLSDDGLVFDDSPVLISYGTIGQNPPQTLPKQFKPVTECDVLQRQFPSGSLM